MSGGIWSMDGERHLYRLQTYPLPQEDMVVGFAQDLSELEQLQEELQRYISAQGDLLESSASAMAIYGADMRLTSYNLRLCRLMEVG